MPLLGKSAVYSTLQQNLKCAVCVNPMQGQIQDGKWTMPA